MIAQSLITTNDSFYDKERAAELHCLTCEIKDKGVRFYTFADKSTLTLDPINQIFSSTGPDGLEPCETCGDGLAPCVTCWGGVTGEIGGMGGELLAREFPIGDEAIVTAELEKAKAGNTPIDEDSPLPEYQMISTKYIEELHSRLCIFNQSKDDMADIINEIGELIGAPVYLGNVSSGGGAQDW